MSFRSAGSILAVCEYCQSTLLNLNGRLEDLGKMAELVEDCSPLQLGAEGTYTGTRFAVLGRIQLRYAQGLWNEWYLLFDNGRTGWLSEAGGEYVISFLKAVPDPLPRFASLKPGESLKLLNLPWTVTNLERAECVAGEGELPFKVGGGYPAPVVDLRSGQLVATLDYSEGESEAAQPLLFVGEAVDFARLNWRNLRTEMPITGKPTLKARVLRCAQCGAPLNLAHEGILAIGCLQCGTVTDTQTEKLLSSIKQSRRVQPLLPLGKIGKFRGEKLEVIGFMQRFMLADGECYRWREYLLARMEQPGYRWLVEYDGHWNVADVLSNPPTGRYTPGAAITWQKRRFKHFQSYHAEVDYVVGEFTWRVKVGEASTLSDHVAPPLLLSEETTEKEISWSLSEYVPHTEIQTVFGLKTLPAPKGVYANQPSPWQEKNRKAWCLFVCFLLIALFLQMVFGRLPKPVYVQESFSLQNTEETTLSGPFTLDKKLPALRVEARAGGLNNNWVELNMSLVNEQTGEALQGSQELSHYSGVGGGESWVEDESKHNLVFRDVPPGIWRLMLEHEVDPLLKARYVAPNQHAPVPVSVRVQKNGSPWGNMLVLLLALLVFPLFTFWRSGSFEIKRWAESDHPMLQGGGDDD